MFAPGASPKGRSGRQTKSGAFGSERLVAGEHVPDRHRQLSGDVDLGHLGPALAAQSALIALVALGVGGVAEPFAPAPFGTALSDGGAA